MIDKSKIIFRVTATFLILLVLGYYVWTAGTNGAPLLTRSGDDYFKTYPDDEIHPGSPHYGYYNLIADSFLAGQLSLLLKPPPALVQLPNPYDPQVNSSLRLHDASLYQGRYYLYFGPVPALVLFIPFRLLPFGKITEPFAVALFGFGAFLLAALILVRLARKFRPAVSDTLLLLAILALGISNAMPFLLRRPVVYEVAISAGVFFMMLGFFFLVRGWQKEGISRQSMVLLSLCWGLAMGCRIVYVLAGIVLVIIWVLVLVKSRERTIRKAVVDALYLGLPFALCLLALGFYNFVRFDSWTDFGIKYQLAAGVIHPETLYRTGNFKPGLYLNALRSPQADFGFPFFRFRTGSPIALPTNYSVEPIAGFLATSPIVIFLCAGWWKRGASEIRPLVALMAGFGLVVLCFEAFLQPGVTMRYQVDFIFPILLTALLFWLIVDARVQSAWVRSGLRCLSIVLILFGIIVHLCLGFTGYYDLFRRSHPQQYFACGNFFAPVSRMLLQASSQGWPAIREVFSRAPIPTPTPVPTATPTPVPTATPTPVPTATPTPVPTATPTATPTSVATVTPTPSAAPIASITGLGLRGLQRLGQVF
jgi:hypothetical protein